MDPIGRELNAEERSVLIVLAQEGRGPEDRTSVGIATALERAPEDVAAVLERLKRDGLTVSDSRSTPGVEVWAVTTATHEAIG